VYRPIAFALLMLASTCLGQSREFSSGPERTDLIELFTSEGCSSCPPADERMNALADDKGLWKEFVPVAFHVDYWNYLGWHDPYSSADYSARQRRYTKEWQKNTSYTPCFVVNGAVSRKPLSSVRIDRTGILTMVLTGNKATVTYVPAELKGNYIAWLAPLSGALTNSVTAGENRGRTLEHAFVALGLADQMMIPSRGALTATMILPDDSRTKAVAAWVSRKDSLKPLQATGGWLVPQAIKKPPSQ